MTAARRQKGLVEKVLGAFEEDVASRQAPGSLHKFESWNESGVEWLGPLS